MSVLSSTSSGLYAHIEKLAKERYNDTSVEYKVIKDNYDNPMLILSKDESDFRWIGVNIYVEVHMWPCRIGFLNKPDVILSNILYLQDVKKIALHSLFRSGDKTHNLKIENSKLDPECLDFVASNLYNISNSEIYLPEIVSEYSEKYNRTISVFKEEKYKIYDAFTIARVLNSHNNIVYVYSRIPDKERGFEPQIYDNEIFPQPGYDWMKITTCECGQQKICVKYNRTFFTL